MKKIKIFIIMSLATVFLLPSSILASTENENNESSHKVDTNTPSLNELLGEIRNVQHIEKNKDINCDKITTKQFQELGEAFMISQNSNEEHELLHEMTEIEDDPESVSLMHVNLGHEYLNCKISYKTISGDIYNEKIVTEKKLINKDIVLGFSVGSIIFLILFKITSSRKKKSDY